MKRTVNIQDFHNAFFSAGRESQFSYEARSALFDYLEQLEDETGEELELDVIALCCDYMEAGIDDLIDMYSIDVSSAEDESDRHRIVSDYLSENGAYIADISPDAYLFRQF